MVYSLDSITAMSVVESLKSISYTDLLIMDILIPIVILVATPLAARIVDHFYFRIEKRPSKLIEFDITRQRMMKSLTHAGIYLLGAVLLLYSIEPLRSIAVGAFASVGILSIVVGLAAQETLSNIIAGIAIVSFKPFKLDDRIKIGDNEGYVEDITLRHTVVRNWQNNRIIFPNQVVAADAIINYSISDERVIEYIEFGISYDSSIALARKIILEESQKEEDVIVEKDEATGKITSPVVNVIGFGDSSVNLRVEFWARSKAKSFGIKYRMFENIKSRFDKEGIEIPFPYRTIVYKKDIPKPKA